MKLTKAQQRVYDEMMRDGEFRCIQGYSPAARLVALDLADEHIGKFGDYRITPKETLK